MKKTRKLILAAMLAALCCIATMVIQIPSPMNGYLNLGDSIVLLSGWVLGPLYGGAAAGIGSALADLLSGYPYYIPGTFLIKAFMAVIAAKLCQNQKRLPHLVLGGACAEIWMVLGYFLYAVWPLGYGGGAIVSIPGNLIQGGVGLVCGVLLWKLVCQFQAAEQPK